MPFNRVNNAKAINFWLLILSSTSKIKSRKSERTDPIETSVSEWWCPGMMVVPLPQAGWLLGYWDMGFWAALFYVLGSVVYVIDSFYLWPYFYPESTDDPADPGVYLNSIAAILFVINALLCILDWYMQREQLSVMNMIIDDSITGGFQFQSVSAKITWYYFFNNFFFLGATVVFLIQAIWMENYDLDIYNCSDGFCGDFWINFWGNFLYLSSSVFSYLEYAEDKKIRKRQGLPPLTLLPYEWDSFDWFGWGDILYVTTSFLQSLQSFFIFIPSLNDNFNAGYYLNANVFFLIDSLAYFIGYRLFLFDMRKALFSGKVPLKQTGIIRDMIEDVIPFSGADESNDNPQNPLVVRQSNSFAEPGGESLFPVFRRVEHGYVSIDEIREKLFVAREIRSHRASDPTDRKSYKNSHISTIQTNFAQRKSETSFSSQNASISDTLFRWQSKTKPTMIEEEPQDEAAVLLQESYIVSDEKDL